MFYAPIFRSLLFLLFIAINTGAASQGFLKAQGQKIVNGKGENVLLRGMGLGGWMLQEGYMLRVPGEGQQHKIRERITTLIGETRTEEFYTAWLANHTRKIDIDSMKAWGFNSVRLPMHYNLYTLPVEDEPVKGKHTWLQIGFDMTDSLLAWCRANQMYLILDLHAAPGGQGNDLNIADRDPAKPSLWQSEANQQKTIALWRKLAERYAHEPWIGAYDIINEPNWGFTDPVNDKNGLKEKDNEPLRRLMVDITKAIREVDRNHIVIIEGNGWGNNYNGILPPWDDNMVLSFHKYWNYNNQASVQHLLNYREKYNIPVWLGETGENSNVWFADAVTLLERNNIGWAWWPLKKLRHNNPMEIKLNPGYAHILAYWQGKAAQPYAGEAYKALMQLANDTRLENTIIKRDVIDALFRQPHQATAIPYTANTVGDKAIIDAVHYDLGRNGIAYFDMDTTNYHVSTGQQRTQWNRGNVYRNDGVDITEDSLHPGNYYVSHIEDNEWLQYTLQLEKAGAYIFKIKYKAATSQGKIRLLINGQSYEALLPISNAWNTIDFSNIKLQQGKNAIRLFATKGGYDLQQMALEKIK